MILQTMCIVMHLDNLYHHDTQTMCIVIHLDNLYHHDTQTMYNVDIISLYYVISSYH